MYLSYLLFFFIRGKRLDDFFCQSLSTIPTIERKKTKKYECHTLALWQRTCECKVTVCLFTSGDKFSALSYTLTKIYTEFWFWNASRFLCVNLFTLFWLQLGGGRLPCSLTFNFDCNVCMCCFIMYSSVCLLTFFCFYFVAGECWRTFKFVVLVGVVADVTVRQQTFLFHIF